MQPYFFPYLGYFQLIHAVDTFVFYDDVNFIKKGFINRNKILLNDKAQGFVIPVVKLSQNKLINETKVAFDNRLKNQFLKTIFHAYHKAPYFDEIYNLIERVVNTKYSNIAELAMNSIKAVLSHIDNHTEIKISSHDFDDTVSFKKAERLEAIYKRLNANVYINPIGGLALYSKEEFKDKNMELMFLQSKPYNYKQFNKPFVSNLSIIDVLMFNSKEDIKLLLTEFTLI